MLETTILVVETDLEVEMEIAAVSMESSVETRTLDMLRELEVERETPNSEMSAITELD